MKLQLLVSPLAKGAYFAEALDVARAELQAQLPGCEAAPDLRETMAFLKVEVPAEALPALARLSFVQGIFEAGDAGLRVVDQAPGFRLPEELVWGAKYAGKTNELVTQLALNLALRFCTATGPLKVLDPMAGRGTTLLWALRYGLSSRGIERDGRALEDLQRHVKRQTKLHRIKHSERRGFVGRKNREGLGRFLQYEIEGELLKLVSGDSRDARTLLGQERFSVIVTDLPYGVQHRGKGGRRNPLAELEDCAAPWTASLKPGGAMVLVFNALQPRRKALLELFTAQGLIDEGFTAPHRMSESILRDLVVLTRPRTEAP